MSTGAVKPMRQLLQKQPAFISLSASSCSILDVNGPGRSHCLLCNLHTFHAHSAGKGGRERSLWCVRRTSVSLGWENDLEWKHRSLC